MTDNLLLAFAALNVWDVLSTLYILDRNGTERNRVFAVLGVSQ